MQALLLSRDEARLFLEAVRVGQHLAWEIPPTARQALREQAERWQAGLAGSRRPGLGWVPGGAPRLRPVPAGHLQPEPYAAVVHLLDQLVLAEADWARQQVAALRTQYPGPAASLDQGRIAAAVRRGRATLAAAMPAAAAGYLPDEDYPEPSAGFGQPAAEEEEGAAGEGEAPAGHHPHHEPPDAAHHEAAATSQPPHPSAAEGPAVPDAAFPVGTHPGHWPGHSPDYGQEGLHYPGYD